MFSHAHQQKCLPTVCCDRQHAAQQDAAVPDHAGAHRRLLGAFAPRDDAQYLGEGYQADEDVGAGWF